MAENMSVFPACPFLLPQIHLFLWRKKEKKNKTSPEACRCIGDTHHLTVPSAPHPVSSQPCSHPQNSQPRAHGSRGAMGILGALVASPSSAKLKVKTFLLCPRSGKYHRVHSCLPSAVQAPEGSGDGNGVFKLVNDFLNSI